MFCPGCGTENADGTPSCEACGLDLTDGADFPPAVPLRRVHVAESLADAAEVKEALEGAGFAALVRDGAGARGDGTDDTGPSVWVPESQAARAVQLLVGREAAPEEGEDWTCPGCGEEIEDQFTECWQCGTGRPGGE